MNETWQSAIVLVVVALAAAYLLLRSVRIFAQKKAAGCGGCSSCPSGSAKRAAPQLRSIELGSSVAGGSQPPGKTTP